VPPILEGRGGGGAIENQPNFFGVGIMGQILRWNSDIVHYM
jgi:hypothetical protein